MDPALQHDLALGSAILEEFLAADTVVIGVPMYNFTIPSQLGAWIDRIVIAGKTFRYTEKGAEGLAGSKRVILALSRGNFYGAGQPLAGLDFQETYLRAVFGFIGVTNIEFVRAEGVAIGPRAAGAGLCLRTHGNGGAQSRLTAREADGDPAPSGPVCARISKARALPFDPVKGEAFEIQLFSGHIMEPRTTSEAL